MLIRRYSELRSLNTFVERFKYLRLAGIVGVSTFGFDRWLNQTLYKTKRWGETRDLVIVRDDGCDLGIIDRPIGNRIYVHHMNPITVDDVLEEKEWVFDPEYLICASHKTHNAIHFGDEKILDGEIVERKPFDTCPWRRGSDG